MDLLRDYKGKNEDEEDEENTNIDNKSSIFKLYKNNKKIDAVKHDINLVSVNEETQVNARKKFYEEIDAIGKDIKLNICLKLTKVVVPSIIFVLIIIYWIVAMMKFYEMV